MSTRLLPLFPLPLVLFPGAPLPLHLFEPRYREMLADCRRGDGRFGIVLASGAAERALPRGHVGCLAELRDVEMLPDGRANVLVEGIERFALDAFVDAPHAYHVARVTDYADLPGDDAASLADAADRVRALFDRVARAAGTIADEADAEAPELPPAPALLAFRVASLVDFGNADRQALLASRSPLERLRRVEVMLGGAVRGIESRADTHRRARTNGHGPQIEGTT